MLEERIEKELKEAMKAKDETKVSCLRMLRSDLHNLSIQKKDKLKDEDGKPIPTSGHHILPRSVYPEYVMTDENIMPLCAVHHAWAEDFPFDYHLWLSDSYPDIWNWANERSRKELNSAKS